MVLFPFIYFHASCHTFGRIIFLYFFCKRELSVCLCVDDCLLMSKVQDQQMSFVHLFAFLDLLFEVVTCYSFECIIAVPQ